MFEHHQLSASELDQVSGGDCGGTFFNLCGAAMNALAAMGSGATAGGLAGGTQPPIVLHEPTGGGNGSNGGGVARY